MHNIGLTDSMGNYYTTLVPDEDMATAASLKLKVQPPQAMARLLARIKNGEAITCNKYGVLALFEAEVLVIFQGPVTLTYQNGEES
jgi:hypothetical protein